VTFLDVLRCFKIFLDVLGCFEMIVASESSPKPKKEPRTQRTKIAARQTQEQRVCSLGKGYYF
jgi:hypothetical protein